MVSLETAGYTIRTEPSHITRQLLHMNYIDLIILALLVIAALRGMQIGFWPLTIRLVSFLTAIAVAFVTYPRVSDLLSTYTDLFPSFTKAVGFLIVFIIVQFLVRAILVLLAERLPYAAHTSPVNKLFAIFPALVDASILIGLLLLVVVSAPAFPRVQSDIHESTIGSVFIEQLTTFEQRARSVFGEAIAETLMFLTMPVDNGETMALPFRPGETEVNESAEAQMLALLNQERARAGAPPVERDEALTIVAREHSQDMWERGYFAHVNPDGESPVDRLRRHGIGYLRAGENLALAPTVEIAHRGLLNSPGHRKTMLDPAYGKVGIGVVDGGRYGKMFTQNFTN
jgi:uncharacterized protein YkwD/uncharacterized membrane protein required for colicin V production